MTKIYALICPETNQIRYVGKTVQSLSLRFQRHLREALKRDTHKNCWIYSLKLKGLKPEIVLIEEVEDCVWQEAEKFYITYFRFLGFPITNIQEGGDVSYEGLSEARRKLSVHGKGRKHTEEAKKKISVGNSGSRNGMFGVKISEEEKEKRRKFHTGRKRSKEDIEKWRIANLGKKRSQESRERMRKSAKKTSITQFDLDGGFIRDWDSIAECCRESGYSVQAISKCINGRSKTSNGFKWAKK